MKRNTHWQPVRDDGFRSGFEARIAEELINKGIPFEYESELIPYIKPASKANYKPDFIFKKKDGGMMYIELKGRFLSADRKKTLLILDQYPDLDLRFVFWRANDRISKLSKTTYAMWCQKNDIQYAQNHIPEAWLEEVENGESIPETEVYPRTAVHP